MRRALLPIRERLDRVGVLLSGLCAVHCVLGVVLVSILGLGGGVLVAPAIHRVGLALALVIGSIALGFGAARHGRTAPLVIGGCGLALMAAAIVIGHGLPEALLTVAGVGLLAFAHIRNLRGAC